MADLYRRIADEFYEFAEKKAQEYGVEITSISQMYDNDFRMSISMKKPKNFAEKRRFTQ